MRITMWSADTSQVAANGWLYFEWTDLFLDEYSSLHPSQPSVPHKLCPGELVPSTVAHQLNRMMVYIIADPGSCFSLCYAKQTVLGAKVQIVKRWVMSLGIVSVPPKEELGLMFKKCVKEVLPYVFTRIFFILINLSLLIKFFGFAFFSSFFLTSYKYF